MARQRWIYRAGIALTLGLVLTGCNGFKAANPKNFIRALNVYYGNNDDCLFPSAIRFPYEAAPATRIRIQENPASTRWPMQACSGLWKTETSTSSATS